MTHEHGGKSSAGIVNTKKVISLLVKENDVFLDIGCGPGDYLKQASKIAKQVIGIDKHEPSIQTVKELGFKGILADATKKIPLKNFSVDSILVSNVLHGFVENKEEKKVLSEISRVLKKEGLLGIVEFKKNALFGPSKEVRLIPEQVEKILELYNFIKVKDENVGLFNYMRLFKKK